MDGLHGSMPLEDIGTGLPALDRLVVARAFDIQTAIQAVQSVKSSAFQSDADGAPVIEQKEDNKGRLDNAAQTEDTAMQMQAVETVLSAAQADDAPTKSAVAAELALKRDDKPIKPSHLSFIVVDSITAIIRPILSAISPEGTASLDKAAFRVPIACLQVTQRWCLSCACFARSRLSPCHRLLC